MTAMFVSFAFIGGAGCQVSKKKATNENVLLETASPQAHSGLKNDLNPNKSFSIVNGDDERGQDDSVFLLELAYTDNNTRKPASSVGTGFAAFRSERCIATARHVIDPGQYSSHSNLSVKVWKGFQPLKDRINSKNSVAVLRNFRPYNGQDFMDTDIGLLWLPAYKRASEINTYVPMPIDPTEQIKANAPRRKPDWALSSNNPRIISYGYGFFDASRLDTAGTRRKGTFDLLEYKNHEGLNDPRAGGYILTYRDKASKYFKYNAICQGDSGGPWTNTKYNVVAVCSANWSPAGNCGTQTDNFGTALDRYDPHPHDPHLAKNNYDYFLYMADQTCTKQIYVKADKANGISYIYGSFVREPSYDINMIELNGLIACKGEAQELKAQNGQVLPDDCTEKINENSLLTFTAVPLKDYKFEKWGSLIVTEFDEKGALIETTARCPCHDSTSANCEVRYNNLGKYDERFSVDLATCVAFAKPTNGNNNGGTVVVPSNE